MYGSSRPISSLRAAISSSEVQAASPIMMSTGSPPWHGAHEDESHYCYSQRQRYCGQDSFYDLDLSSSEADHLVK